MRHKIILSVIVGLFFLAGNFLLERWEQNIYYGDSSHYYLHLVSFFINQDVGDYDKTITTLIETNPGSQDPREDIYGVRLTEKGRRYIKYTVGVPVMETPFFLLGHAYASLVTTDRFQPNGWTRPYKLMISLSTIVYLMLGIYLLIGVLERYFTRKTVTIVILALALATNLFYHATYVTMSHGFLFFDYCLLIWLSVKYYESPNVRKALGLGLVVGLITITRVPEIIAACIPVLWGIASWQDAQDRLRHFWQHRSHLLWAFVGFMVFMSLQIAYWYYVSGKFYFNPYQGEGFDFLHPKIHKGWFHFSNGWLIYTPIMVFGLLGIGWLKRYTTAPFWPLVVFVGLQSYIHYSYYAWTFFPGLGQRPMVETYPLLAFSMAAIFSVFHEKRMVSWLPTVLLLVFGALNLFQTWQMRQGIIWSERHNYGFYVESFGQLHSTQNALRAYDCKEPQPDSSDLVLVQTILEDDFSGAQWDTVAMDTFGRKDVLVVSSEFLTLIDLLPIEAASYDYLGIAATVYSPHDKHPGHRDGAINLIVEITDATGKKIKNNSIKPVTHINNPTWNIWTSGVADAWGSGSFFQKSIRRKEQDARLKVYIYNHSGGVIAIDDLVVKAYRKR
ncbi:MAG: hypothetical protein R2795_09560 [Saprospiraceae bacterium]